MRKKIARELRKDALRRGAILSGEKYIMSKRELREECLKASDNGFEITLDYRGEHYCIVDNTELDCYRMLLDVMDMIDEMAADGCVLDGCTIHNMPDGYLCMSHLDCE